MNIPDQVNSYLKKGITAQQKGQLDFAASLYRDALELDPRNADAFDLLGLVFMQKENLDQAFAYVYKAIQILPQNPFFHNDIGEISLKQGNLENSIKYFEASVALKPDYTDARFNLASAYNKAGERAKAINHFKFILTQDPDNANVHKKLGFIYYIVGAYGEAAAHNKRAISLTPTDFHPYYNLGIVLQCTGDWDEAIRCYSKVIELNPSFHMAYHNLGAIFYDKKEYGKAIKYYAKTIGLAPEYDICYMNLGKVYEGLGDIEEARKYYIKSNSIKKKDSVDVILALTLPPIYGAIEEIEKGREKLKQNLEALEGRRLSIPDPLRDIGIPNFYSAYHEYDEKAVQIRINSILKPLFGPEEPIKRKIERGKIKIGMISKHFKDHTIGKLTRGIIAKLSRDDFTVTTISVGRYNDPMAKFIKENSDQFFNAPINLRQCGKMIKDLNLDILYYADIGMDPLTYYLSFSRLAPVQCVTWGHPVTTGRDTMDYFISSELIEPINGEEHYTEKLIKLKTLNVYYYKPDIRGNLKGRNGFGLPEGANLYLCPQTLMKIHPDFDLFIQGIIRKDPQGYFVLIKSEYENWNSTLMRRFEKYIPDIKDRILLIDRIPYRDFLNLLATSDVVLDPIYFGGGNTSYEAFATGAPIVTLPGKYMRSRLTYGQYKLMDMMDCVAKDMDEYIDIAVRLGADKKYNKLIRSKIFKKNHVLYENENSIKELENIFKDMVSKQQRNFHKK